MQEQHGENNMNICATKQKKKKKKHMQYDGWSSYEKKQCKAYDGQSSNNASTLKDVKPSTMRAEDKDVLVDSILNECVKWLTIPEQGEDHTRTKHTKYKQMTDAQHDDNGFTLSRSEHANAERPPKKKQKKKQTRIIEHSKESKGAIHDVVEEELRDTNQEKIIVETIRSSNRESKNPTYKQNCMSYEQEKKANMSTFMSEIESNKEDRKRRKKNKHMIPGSKCGLMPTKKRKHKQDEVRFRVSSKSNQEKDENNFKVSPLSKHITGEVVRLGLKTPHVGKLTDLHRVEGERQPAHKQTEVKGKKLKKNRLKIQTASFGKPVHSRNYSDTINAIKTEPEQPVVEEQLETSKETTKVKKSKKLKTVHQSKQRKTVFSVESVDTRPVGEQQKHRRKPKPEESLEENRKTVPSVEPVDTRLVGEQRKHRRKPKPEESPKEYKMGKWSGAEDKLLKENTDKFCKEYGIADKRKLFYASQYDDGKQIRSLIMSSDFYRVLGEGLSRSHDSIYCRGRKLFDPDNYKGPFKPKEIRELIRLHNLHGPNWTLIGNTIGRSSRCVNAKFRTLKKNRVTGPWSEEERTQLKEAMKEVVGLEAGDDQFFNIPWAKVADMVPTRNYIQCRTQWLFYTHDKASDKQEQHEAWTNGHAANLIEKIYSSNVTEESEVDWLNLYKKYFQSEPSPQSLQGRWTTLKQRYIAQYHLKTFEEIVDVMHQYVLPRLTVPVNI